MKKYICLRDDDTNYYTTLQELEKGYGKYWGQLPITLATIPFVHGSERKILEVEKQADKFRALRNWEMQASVEELTDYHKVHPIAENKELVYALKKLIKANKIEIAQHGVSHRYNEFGAETDIQQIVLPAIRDGKEYLEKTFETDIKTYIPPSNHVDVTCAKYINTLGMNLFTSGGLYFDHKYKKILSFITSPMTFVEKMRQIKSRKPTPINRRGGIIFFGSYTYGSLTKQGEIWEAVKTSLEQTGFAGLSTHYRNFVDEKYNKDYLELLGFIGGLSNVEFVTAQKYHDLLMERYYV